MEKLKSFGCLKGRYFFFKYGQEKVAGLGTGFCGDRIRSHTEGNGVAD